MKKRIIAGSILFALLLGGGLYLNSLLPVITGYAAKNLASGVFVAGRSQESLEKEDLNFSFIKYAANNVDFNKKEVTSRFLWGRSKAVFIDGFGCTLVKDYTEEEIRGRPYCIPASLPANPDTIPWPLGNLVTDSIPEGVNPVKLKKAIAKIMSDTVPFKGTFAIMVVYDGQPVAEVYRNDFDHSTRFLSWSMAKSITNALVALRAGEGLININNPINMGEWQNDARADVTLSNLLQMNSGLRWNESYGNISDVTVMLHKVGNMGEYAATKPSESPPGSHWLYSSGSTNLANLLLRRSFSSDSAYFCYPRKALFNKTGMRSAVFEVDASGTFAGSSYLYATMRDYARFGLLYLNNGDWLGEQLIPKEWITYTTTPANVSEGQYGACFWLNRSGKMPDAPGDTFWCSGHDGQYIFIIPSRKLVIVRTGFSKKGEFDANLMLKEILETISY